MNTEAKFKEFIESIPHGLYRVFRRRLLEALCAESLEVSDQTIRNWENGRCEPNDGRRDVVNRVAEAVIGRPVYEKYGE